MMKTFSEGQTYVQNEGVQNEKMVERHEKIAILGDESKKIHDRYSTYQSTLTVEDVTPGGNLIVRPQWIISSTVDYPSALHSLIRFMKLPRLSQRLLEQTIGKNFD